jgi:ADP-ribose pyrophosphatase YjhB (NUDIX family)
VLGEFDDAGEGDEPAGGCSKPAMVSRSWALPGGGHEPGESIADTVIREVKEETGYDIEVETITGTYTNRRHVMAYDDGEVRQQFSIAFRARLVGGQKQTSDESSEVEWLTPEQIDELDLHPSMRLRLQHALSRQQRPFIG